MHAEAQVEEIFEEEKSIENKHGLRFKKYFEVEKRDLLRQ